MNALERAVPLIVLGVKQRDGKIIVPNLMEVLIVFSGCRSKIELVNQHKTINQ